MKEFNITISPPLLLPKTGEGEKKYTREEIFSFSRYHSAHRLNNSGVSIQELIVRWEKNNRWDWVEQVPLYEFEKVQRKIKP